MLQFGLVDANEGLRAALAGDAATVTRRMAEAEEHFEVALELLAGTTDRANAITARTQLGAARCWRGQFKQGLDDLKGAVAEAARSGFKLREVQGRLELGFHLVAAGREQEGLAILAAVACGRPRNSATCGVRPMRTSGCRPCTKRAATSRPR